MKFSVYVLGRDVAVLEQTADPHSVLTYHANTTPGDFVSLGLPVRTEPYRWDGLSLAGAGAMGRVQLAAPGAALMPAAQATDLVQPPNPLQPFSALNEHLCLQVASRVMLTAHTDLSSDGQTLTVQRFDLNAHGQHHWGVEDFGALLSLSPSGGDNTSWEQIAQAVRDEVSGSGRGEAFRHLASRLLLSFALRDAGCNAHTLALRYTSRANVQAAPAHGLLTTGVYADTAGQLPAMAFMNKKIWTPGRNLQKFIATAFGIAPKEQAMMAEAVCDAVADVAPQVLEAMNTHPAFSDLGRGMLAAWAEGAQGLRDKHVYALGAWKAGATLAGSD